MNKALVAIIFLLLSTTLTFGQRKSRPDKFGVGLGPAFLYGDNTGIHSDLQFKILPVASVDYTSSISDFFDIRATVGWQMIGSGDFYSEGLIQGIANAGYPHAFKGSLFFADVTPYYIFNPDRRGFVASEFKFYAGLGVGVFHSMRTDTRRIIEGDNFFDEEYKDSNTNIYLPLRLGGFVRIPDTYSDLGVEGTLLISPLGSMEGNDKQQKTFKTDMAVQLQVFYRIHFW